MHFYRPKLFFMRITRCNYCGQNVQFIDVRGNNTCPVCRQSSTSCCEGGSCEIVYSNVSKEEKTTTKLDVKLVPSSNAKEHFTV
jgi:hypothetical protein